MTQTSVCITAIKRTLQYKKILFPALLILFLFIIGPLFITRGAVNEYQALESDIIFDRWGVPVRISPNERGHFQLSADYIPDQLINLIIKKEDRYFKYHPGINPVSMFRALVSSSDRRYGGSTITQQLAKNLLGNEQNRTISNKLYESWYALGLEWRLSKKEILEMYTNTTFVGNRYQGLAMGSLAYFNTSLNNTTIEQQISLLATLSHPASRNPWQENHVDYFSFLAAHLLPEKSSVLIAPTPTSSFQTQSNQAFELSDIPIRCQKTIHTSLDIEIHEKIQDILNKHVQDMRDVNINQGAVVVIDPQKSELISIVGTTNPRSQRPGNQINMAIQDRPTGSTIKPFIYGKAFETEARPYSLIDDREYRYPIASGFPLYPKNYDGKYRGEVTLHESLSGSLNVPTVKVLNHIGLDTFYDFLETSMKFKSLQDFDTYEYGIALGGLEMDLLTLTHYFTALPRHGSIKPLYLNSEQNCLITLPSASINHATQIFSPAVSSLVHTILRDRDSAVTQFGLRSNLNIPHHDYGVKTGTSRDYHDSWIIGYTNDLVVGVWLGNADNTPMVKISGQQGAGLVWHDVMQYLLTTPYNTNTIIKPDSDLVQFQFDNSLEWGLKTDVPDIFRTILLDEKLIHFPHNNDVYMLSDTTKIQLRSKSDVQWYVDDQYIATGLQAGWQPYTTGSFEVVAIDSKNTTRKEKITIHLTD